MLEWGDVKTWHVLWVRFFRNHLKPSDRNVLLSFGNLMSDALWFSNPSAAHSSKENPWVHPGWRCFVFKARGPLSDLVFSWLPPECNVFVLLCHLWELQKLLHEQTSGRVQLTEVYDGDRTLIKWQYWLRIVHLDCRVKSVPQHLGIMHFIYPKRFCFLFRWNSSLPRRASLSALAGRSPCGVSGVTSFCVTEQFKGLKALEAPSWTFCCRPFASVFFFFI